MTKKDFELIAQTVQGMHSLTTSAAPLGGSVPLHDVAQALAEALSYSNPRFDRDRFLRACVPGANVRARGTV